MNNNSIQTYAAYNTDDSIRKESSSGGVFSVLAEYIISCGGIVYGVEMSADCYTAEFVRITSVGKLGRIRGSKYIQARVGDTFSRVKRDLDSGLNVLFSGTGCQVNGIKSFLGKDYSNLYCVDVVCHGVPSKYLWKIYIDSQERKYGKVSSINFRCKDKGWENFGIKENYVYIHRSRDSFFRLFLRDYCLRPSCYECDAKCNKQSDISLADFWGINRVCPEMHDNDGVSLVLVRNEKGNRLFNKCSQRIKSKEIDYAEAIKYNPAESVSAIRPKQRDTFYSDLSKLEFEEIIKKYVPVTAEERVDSVIRNIKQIVKRTINYAKIHIGGVLERLI